jgi:hypothetical protein
MSKKRRYVILIIRIKATLVVALVWIMRGPQSIHRLGAFNLNPQLDR